MGSLSTAAVLGIIIGFFGRQVIANLVSSGVLLAITQADPLNPNLVSIGDELRSPASPMSPSPNTSVDACDGSLIVVPNERVATDVVINHALRQQAGAGDRRRWSRPDADVDTGLSERGEVTSAHLLEVTPEGARLQSGRDRLCCADREAHEGPTSG